MLSIYIHGATESGFLDLEPGSKLDMEETAPAFDEDLSIGEYSLPFSGIVWSENNRRLLLQAQDLNNATPVNIFTCSVFNNNYPEIVKGKLTILGKEGTINSRSGKFSVSISGSKGMYGTLIANKKMTDLTLGGRIEWTGMDSREFAQELMDGNLSNDYWYLQFVPVAIETFFNSDRSDYSGEFLAKDVVNNLVEDGVPTFVFGRPTTADPTIAASSGTAEYIDYRTVPFFRILYVLRKCFEEFGYTLNGDFIDDPYFYNLLLFNNYGIERYNGSSFIDNNRSISPQNHVPDMLVSDFLRGLFGLFNLYPIFAGDNTVQLRYRVADIAQKKIKNIDHMVRYRFESAFEEGVATSGYKLNYQWDSNDSYPGDRIKDLTSKTLCATVTLYTDLLTLDIGRSFTTDDIVLVEAENMYYQVADATTLPVIKWDAWAERLQEYTQGDGKEGKDYAISTICQYALFNEAEGLLQRRNHLGCRQHGSYINNKGETVKHEFGLRVFYGAQVAIGGIPRPMSYNHTRRPDNNTVLETYSLAWLGDEGLGKKLHAAWHDNLQQKEKIKLPVTATPKDLADLRNANTIELQHKHFVLHNTERSIPADDSTVLHVSPL